MRGISEENVLEYLVAGGHLPDATGPVRRLGGGVSNVVLQVQAGPRAVVVKQALPRLNVAEVWEAKVERLRTEVEAMRLLAEILPPGAVPRVYFFDPENYVYGMSAASDRFEVWKARLLRGRIDLETVRAVAALLACMHSQTAKREDLKRRFNDLEAFWQLRIDPYYNTVRRRHPDVASQIEAVMAWASSERHALVHGDYSPKNLLVDEADVVLLDCEVAHYGDPAFDVAFLINHLLLKAVHLEDHGPALRAAAEFFWREYRAAVAEGARAGAFEQRVVGHLAGLHLARVDGKSPVEYLTSERARRRVRGYAKGLLKEPPATVSEAIARHGESAWQ